MAVLRRGPVRLLPPPPPFPDIQGSVQGRGAKGGPHTRVIFGAGAIDVLGNMTNRIHLYCYNCGMIHTS